MIQASGGEVPTSCALEDLGICDSKPLALSRFPGGPHQLVSLALSLPEDPPGDPVMSHESFLSSLRGIIEGEQEISLVPGQP